MQETGDHSAPAFAIHSATYSSALNERSCPILNLERRVANNRISISMAIP